MRQGSVLVATKNFCMRKPGSRGRYVNVKIGDKFMVTCPMHMIMTTIKIDRLKTAHINCGYDFPMDILSEYFEMEG